MPKGDPVQARAAERAEMVRTQIERRDVRADAVLDVLLSVPREWFVPEGLSGKAYTDAALPIDCEQTISQPYMVARMTELLELGPQQRVLEIGTGSGYQTAILALLAGRVYTIEWYLKLMNQAAERLERLGRTNVTYRCGDGSLGWPEHAPYDAILVTAGAPAVPKSLSAQLAPGGRLVIPVGGKKSQTLVRVVRTESGLEREEYLGCRFVRLVGEEGWAD